MSLDQTILLAEGNRLNLKILKEIFDKEYWMLTAENSEDAIRIMQNHSDTLSAVILDLELPGGDGYELLDKIHSEKKFESIPIIAATGIENQGHEEKALEHGATDFVTKPYVSGILKYRVHNAIEKSRLDLFNRVKHIAEHDILTGLYNTRKFLSETGSMLLRGRGERFIMARLDIERFKQFNALFGREAGDEFLRYIAEGIKVFGSSYPESTFARIDADIFAVCCRYDSLQSFINSIREFQFRIKNYSSKFDIILTYGLYVIDNEELPVSEMLDRATLAAKAAKGRYLNTVSIYTDEMGEAQNREQKIVNEMNYALENGQFCVYYQPKYNLETGAVCGAEALVRWKHPENGLVSPGVFVPIFEKNGFIAKVDQYVWEKTCESLRQWSDAGLHPHPVSVNVSRVNLSNPQITDIICDLVNRFGINPELLQLEITESAYMDNPENMNRVVERFHDKGFVVLMDDFGSGFSSLNTLKDISVDILKIDMKFLPTGTNNLKSERILASIIKMANWIGMPTIVEGVETQAQRDYLRSVGCKYAQGFFYSRPVPKEEYELILASQPSVPEENTDKNVENLFDSRTRSVHETVLYEIPVPVSVLKYTAGGFKALQVNKKFDEVFGEPKKNAGPYSGSAFLTALGSAAESRGGSECQLMVITENDGPVWFRVLFRYIEGSDDGHIISVVYTNISGEKRIESELSRIAGILNRNSAPRHSILILNDIPEESSLLDELFGDKYELIRTTDFVQASDALRVGKDDLSLILLNLSESCDDCVRFTELRNSISGAGEIPIIVISPESDETVQSTLIRLGINDFITKPFALETVKKRIHNVLDFQDRFNRLVSEFRGALSLYPSVGKELTRLYFSLTELRVLLSYMSTIFDVVRIVDPEDTSVITIGEDNIITKQRYTCFKVWNKNTRCNNCTSICAMRQKCQLTKYEFIENDVFYVISRPIELIIDDNKTVNTVLEIVSHVSDSVLSQTVDGVSIKQLAESTRQKIYCDPLTGAYNRRYLYEMLFISRSRNDTAEKIAFVLLDLNRFKSINDNYGHDEGDRILTEVSAVLKSSLRESDSVIRYGGDEFLAVLTDCEESAIEGMISKMSDAIGKIRYGKMNEYTVNAKFGYSFNDSFKPDTKLLNNEIINADKMMYRTQNKYKSALLSFPRASATGRSSFESIVIFYIFRFGNAGLFVYIFLLTKSALYDIISNVAWMCDNAGVAELADAHV